MMGWSSRTGRGEGEGALIALITSSIFCTMGDLGDGGTGYTRPGTLSMTCASLSSRVFASSSNKANALSERTGAVTALEYDGHGDPSHDGADGEALGRGLHHPLFGPVTCSLGILDKSTEARRLAKHLLMLFTILKRTYRTMIIRSITNAAFNFMKYA